MLWRKFLARYGAHEYAIAPVGKHHRVFFMYHENDMWCSWGFESVSKPENNYFTTVPEWEEV